MFAGRRHNSWAYKELHWLPIGLLAAGAVMGERKTLTTITLRKFGLVVYWRGTQRANNGFVAVRFTVMVESCYRFFFFSFFFFLEILASYTVLSLVKNLGSFACCWVSSEPCLWKEAAGRGTKLLYRTARHVRMFMSHNGRLIEHEHSMKFRNKREKGGIWWSRLAKTTILL